MSFRRYSIVRSESDDAVTSKGAAKAHSFYSAIIVNKNTHNCHVIDQTVHIYYHHHGKNNHRIH